MYCASYEALQWLREFQRKLHERAKAEPKFRFYSLYDKTYRADVLAEAYRKAKANGGTSGVDGETFEDVEQKGVTAYLAELQLHFEGGTGDVTSSPAIW